MDRLFINYQNTLDENPNFAFIVESLDKSLPPDWEIYTEPFLNGAEPDIVLLNENQGIHIIDTGLKPHDPVPRIIANHKHVIDLWCPRSKSISSEAIYSSYLDLIKEKDEIQLNNRHKLKYINFSIISKSEINDKGEIIFEDVIPLLKNPNNKFTKDMAEDFRGWIRISDFKLDDREDIPQLDQAQTKLLEKPIGKTGYRRIRGAAGSGKTMVLAHKAAKLIAEGKSVLILTFNITLVNYIRSLVFRALKTYDPSNKSSMSNFEIYWFHLYVYRYFVDIGYEGVWKDAYSKDKDREDKRDSNKVIIPEKFLEYLDKPDCKPKKLFDAILVDEGSDFVPMMWQGCRKLHKEDGEAYLVKDGSQDIYENEKDWTEEEMGKCGFRGPWNELRGSYRLPYDYIHKIKTFIDMHLSKDEDTIYPEAIGRAPDTPDMFLEAIKTNSFWYQVSEQENTNKCIELLLETIPLIDEFSYKNILFLTLEKSNGLDVVNRLESSQLEYCLEVWDDKGRKTLEKVPITEVKKDVPYKRADKLGRVKTVMLTEDPIIAPSPFSILHTFYRDDRVEKISFHLGDDHIKATTVYSIKGFEGPLIVLQITPRARGVSESKQKKLVYTALTRLRLGMNSKCHIYVVCSDPLFMPYGMTWGENFYDHT